MLFDIDFIKKNIQKNKVLLYIGLAFYFIGLICGLILNKGSLGCFYEENALNFYKTYLEPNVSSFKFLFVNILNVILLYLVVALFSLTNLTLYLNFLLVFYKGFTLGVSIIFLVLAFGLNGFFIFLFLVLILNVFSSFSILLLIINLNNNINFNDICKKKYFIKIVLISLIIAILGCFISFFFLIAIIRPFNLFF